jgi:hypothetical protein
VGRNVSKPEREWSYHQTLILCHETPLSKSYLRGGFHDGMITDYEKGFANFKINGIPKFVPFVQKQNYLGMAYLKYRTAIPPGCETLLSIQTNKKIGDGSNLFCNH